MARKRKLSEKDLERIWANPEEGLRLGNDVLAKYDPQFDPESDDLDLVVCGFACLVAVGLELENAPTEEIIINLIACAKAAYQIGYYEGKGEEPPPVDWDEIMAQNKTLQKMLDLSSLFGYDIPTD